MALVRVNEQGRRIGETHRNARHSDEDVERAIAAYEVLLSQGELEATHREVRAEFERLQAMKSTRNNDQPTPKP